MENRENLAIPLAIQAAVEKLQEPATTTANNAANTTENDAQDTVKSEGDAASIQVSSKGTSTVTVEPDLAEIVFGVSSAAETADAASQANEKAVQELIRKLTSQVAEEQMEKTGFDLYQNYSFDSTGNRTENGYTAQTSLVVRVTDLTKVSTVASAAIENGANHAYSVTYGLQNPNEAYKNALEAAFKNAKENATTLAKAAGKQVGDIVFLADETPEISENTTQKIQVDGEDAPVTQKPETMRITAQVSAKFTLK